ncbi:MAG: XRE family transcriptional regulator [Candidatus Latescibacterota bacterium]
MEKKEHAIRIGARLRTARQRAHMTQQELARAMGLRHRQTLVSIEAGERRLTAEELLRAMGVLHTEADYFTDSFRLVGEGRFSFRTYADVDPGVLEAFEDRAGRWAAAYRELGIQQGEGPRWVERKLAVTEHSSYEDTQAAADALREEWALGSPPAPSVQSAMERRLGTLVLYVDAPPGVSGAALQVQGLNAVLVNRREPEGRRNYDLAQELFHLLTWDALPPDRLDMVEPVGNRKRKRVEQLANSFAAALLMPEGVMRERWEKRPVATDLQEWVVQTAEDLQVSASACMWRLRNLDCLSQREAAQSDARRLATNARAPETKPPVPRFSEPFITRIARGLDMGRLSARRAASLLGLSLPELHKLLRARDIDPSFEV